jgi:hypothetical protein
MNEHRFDPDGYTGVCQATYCGSKDLLDGEHIVTIAERAAWVNARATAAVKDTGLGAERKLTPTIEVGGCTVTAKFDEAGVLVITATVGDSEVRYGQTVRIVSDTQSLMVAQ